MGSIHRRQAEAEMQWIQHTARAELLSPRIQGKSGGTVGDEFLSGDVATQALAGGRCNDGNCYWALAHVLC